jgi:hypothetical protein
MTRPAPPPTIPVSGSAADRTRIDDKRVARPTPTDFGSPPEPDLVDAQILRHVLEGGPQPGRRIRDRQAGPSPGRTRRPGARAPPHDPWSRTSLPARAFDREPSQPGPARRPRGPPTILTRRPPAHSRLQTPSRSGCGATPMPKQAHTRTGWVPRSLPRAESHRVADLPARRIPRQQSGTYVLFGDSAAEPRPSPGDSRSTRQGLVRWRAPGCGP